ncbi:hypothetical protein C8J57DRAFT_1538074 [Mycena rebaudengoi]|nr:hypothetical protein C8J57DRAFT_1538074 [Mycena rebaudengoi]
MDPGSTTTKQCGPVWLATSPNCRSPGPGAFVSWDSCKLAAEGISSGGGTHYSSYSLCIPAWHAQCDAGAHLHPTVVRAPATPKVARSSRRGEYTDIEIIGASYGNGVRVPTIWIPDNPHTIPSPTVAATLSSVSDLTATDGDQPTEYFAIQGSRVVDSSRSKALYNFEALVKRMGDGSMVTTDDLEVATFFAAGHSYQESLVLAAEVRSDGAQGDQDTEAISKRSEMAKADPAKQAANNAKHAATAAAAKATKTSEPRCSKRGAAPTESSVPGSNAGAQPRKTKATGKGKKKANASPPSEVVPESEDDVACTPPRDITGSEGPAEENTVAAMNATTPATNATTPAANATTLVKTNTAIDSGIATAATGAAPKSPSKPTTADTDVEPALVLSFPSAAMTEPIAAFSSPPPAMNIAAPTDPHEPTTADTTTVDEPATATSMPAPAMPAAPSVPTPPSLAVSPTPRPPFPTDRSSPPRSNSVPAIIVLKPKPSGRMAVTPRAKLHLTLVSLHSYGNNDNEVDDSQDDSSGGDESVASHVGAAEFRAVVEKYGTRSDVSSDPSPSTSAVRVKQEQSEEYIAAAQEGWGGGAMWSPYLWREDPEAGWEYKFPDHDPRTPYPWWAVTPAGPIHRKPSYWTGEIPQWRNAHVKGELLPIAVDTLPSPPPPISTAMGSTTSILTGNRPVTADPTPSSNLSPPASPIPTMPATPATINTHATPAATNVAAAPAATNAPAAAAATGPNYMEWCRLNKAAKAAKRARKARWKQEKAAVMAAKVAMEAEPPANAALSLRPLALEGQTHRERHAKEVVQPTDEVACTREKERRARRKDEKKKAVTAEANSAELQADVVKTTSKKDALGAALEMEEHAKSITEEVGMSVDKKKSQELKEGNPDFVYNLQEVRRLVKADVETKPLSKEENNALMEEYARDVTWTGDMIYDEFAALLKRTGTKAFAVITSSFFGNNVAPTVIGTTESRAFIPEILGMTSDNLALKFNFWAKNKDSLTSAPAPAAAAQRKHHKDCQKHWVSLWKDHHRDVTGDPDAQVHYEGFDKKTGVQYGLKCVGWPTNIPFKAPSNMGQGVSAAVKLLTERFTAGHLKLVKLSTTEWEELKERVAEEEKEKKRQKAAEKTRGRREGEEGGEGGKVPAAPKRKLSAAEEDQDNDEAPAAKKSKKAAASATKATKPAAHATSAAAATTKPKKKKTSTTEVAKARKHAPACAAATGSDDDDDDDTDGDGVAPPQKKAATKKRKAAKATSIPTVKKHKTVSVATIGDTDDEELALPTSMKAKPKPMAAKTSGKSDKPKLGMDVVITTTRHAPQVNAVASGSGSRENTVASGSSTKKGGILGGKAASSALPVGMRSISNVAHGDDDDDDDSSNSSDTDAAAYKPPKAAAAAAAVVSSSDSDSDSD